MQILNKLAIAWLCLFISYSAFAIDTQNAPQSVNPYSVADYDTGINKFYAWLNTKNAPDLASRIDLSSSYFLNKPYLLGALGEGPDGEFDQGPLYRDDAFDCLTYVSTVVALVISNNLTEFQKNIRLINYENGEVLFSKRNHFTSSDWNINNQKQGFIRDITTEIKNPDGTSSAITSTIMIDKAAWFKKLKINQLKFLPNSTPSDIEKSHANLQALSTQHTSVESRVTYLPFTALFDKNGQPNLYLFNQIPSGAIVEIVRPKWDLREQIGTYLQISHLGFAIRTPQGLMFREASRDPKYMKVVDLPLIDYLQNSLKSPTIKGINIQVIRRTHRE